MYIEQEIDIKSIQISLLIVQHIYWISFVFLIIKDYYLIWFKWLISFMNLFIYFQSKMTIILIYFILISTLDSELKWHAMRSVHISVMTNVTLYSGSVTYSEILSICTISVMTLSMESSLSLAILTRWWSKDRLGTPDLTSISRSKLDSLIPAASPCRLPCI